MTAVESYADRRERLLEELRTVRQAGRTFGLKKSTSNLFRDRNAAGKRLIDVAAFDHVLAIDRTRRRIEAEGMTTYDALVATALEHGLMPAVVPQLKTITLGGAAAGVGIEASSFKNGLVHETIDELEVITGDGRIVVCRPDNEHSDLFFAFPNAYGTLGYALRLRAAVVPVKPVVELEHRRYTDVTAFFDAVGAACDDEADFLDGVAFGRRELYLNVCRFVDRAAHVSDYTFEHIYYRSIREKACDWLTTRDFIWRWDTDWFWCSKNLGAQIPWLRRLYGRGRLGSRTYQRIMRWNSRWGFTRALDHLRGGHSESVIQDVDIPLEHAERFMDFYAREVGLWPMWICPVKAGSLAAHYTLYPMKPQRLYVNFGFWDVLHRPQRFPAGHFNRLVEREVNALGGIKSLYSDSYFSEDDFGRIYGGAAYRELKAKYDPHQILPDLYAKCVLHR
jgi:FAD/FMN-containing dehydrogenase